MATGTPWPRRAFRRIGRALLLILALYLVARAAVEIVTVNPTKPETYRQDWGGPHYLGVLFVHAGPGALIVGLTLRHRIPRARTKQSQYQTH